MHCCNSRPFWFHHCVFARRRCFCSAQHASALRDTPTQPIGPSWLPVLDRDGDGSHSQFCGMPQSLCDTSLCKCQAPAFHGACYPQLQSQKKQPPPPYWQRCSPGERAHEAPAATAGSLALPCSCWSIPHNLFVCPSLLALSSLLSTSSFVVDLASCPGVLIGRRSQPPSQGDTSDAQVSGSPRYPLAS